jgi:hypothetical protein
MYSIINKFLITIREGGTGIDNAYVSNIVVIICIIKDATPVV